MNELTHEKRCQVISCLVEGNSIRATVRITGVAKNTVAKLLVNMGRACSEYQDRVFRNLSLKRLECDEIWAFCYAKAKNVPPELKGQFGYGDVWTWVAIDAETKLVPSWLVGTRFAPDANAFMQDVAARLSNRVQLTTDGHGVYLEAVESAFGGDIDYAMLVNLYGQERAGEARYSPAKCIGAEKKPIVGKPDPRLVSASYAERQNLTMRMGMRRFTRLTNGFSKKLENHEAAIALHFMHYNFCRVHQTLRITPAMAANVTDRLWEISDIVGLLS